MAFVATDDESFGKGSESNDTYIIDVEGIFEYFLDFVVFDNVDSALVSADDQIALVEPVVVGEVLVHG